ncbi:MAG: 5-formyltetrahydrofolate cyclo-ligase [Epulopiscium sp.]|nr:5-formyltetrahydrofolate cyclo-ligase [Candidatus Epulonipiscium sp.]
MVRRNSMSPEEIQCYSHQICNKIIESPRYKKAKKIFVFVSTGTEINTIPLILHGLALGKIIAVPKVFPKEKKMIFSRIKNLGELKKGHFGILEPSIQWMREENSDIQTLFIIPGLVFDLQKYRIGYGGGYYDTYLETKRHSAMTIGVAYDFQVIPKLPREPHDVALDWIITEKRWI